ncbi:MAG: aspartate/glutamate racemase family protein [Bacillota bacterium]
MKTIGLIGGMSWESTAVYYRIINEAVKDKLGGLNSAKIILYSFNFDEIAKMQRVGAWPAAEQEMVKAARLLSASGADFIVICTNTMHKISPAVESAVDVPLLHIADPTAEAIKQSGLNTVGLLGTLFTMEEEFFKDRLCKGHSIDVLIPPEADRLTLHRVIFDELCQGKVLEQSRQEYCRIIQRLADRGAQGMVLGCTEISMLICPADSTVPLFDTTAIHALKAVEWALDY